jgi:hypothetical protein
VRPYVQFAVNEECVAAEECNRYLDFLVKDKKPVFHIEYPSETSLIGGLGLGGYTVGGSGGREGKSIKATERKKFCAERSKGEVSGSKNFQTVLKFRKLDGWVTYCNGSVATTPTHEVSDPGSRFGKRGIETVGEDSPVASNQQDYPLRPQPDAVDLEPSMSEWTRKVAEEDGYPFPPGKGSENFISDEELEDEFIQQTWRRVMKFSSSPSFTEEVPRHV